MELKQKVEALISEINQTHKYSMSRIYGLYNEVFGVAETPQSCASCLIRKANELRQWLQKQPNEILDTEVSEKEIEAQPIDKQSKKRGRKPKSI